MRYKEWRELYGQQAISEGWMLYCLSEFKLVGIRSLIVSPEAGIRNGLDSGAKATEYVKHRATIDRDPAAIHALEIIDGQRIADKLSK